MKESTALDAAQELLNYRKVSIFSSEIFLLMKFEKIIDVIMSFLKENFSCQHIGFVPVKSGTPTKQITYPSGEVTECSPEIEKFLSLQVANQKTVSHFEVTPSIIFEKRISRCSGHR